MGIERPGSSIVDTITETLEQLSENVRIFFNKIAEAIGYNPENLTEEQAERLAFGAEIESDAAGGLNDSRFDDVTNPLNESGESDLRNILRVPTAWEVNGEEIPEFGRVSEQDNSWVREGNDLFWQDHMGYLIPETQVKFLIRDGYNPEQDGTIEEYMERRCNPPGADNTFLGFEIEGGVHPVIRGRLRLAEQQMEELGISYSRDGTNTIDSIKGFQYRTMGHDVISLHSFGLAIDFSKNQNNRLTHLSGDNSSIIEDDDLLNRYIQETDYSRDFYDVMDSVGFIPFGDWVANRRNGNTRDLMEFRCKPGGDGSIPYQFNEDIHRRA